MTCAFIGVCTSYALSMFLVLHFVGGYAFNFIVHILPYLTDWSYCQQSPPLALMAAFWENWLSPKHVVIPIKINNHNIVYLKNITFYSCFEKWLYPLSLWLQTLLEAKLTTILQNITIQFTLSLSLPLTITFIPLYNYNFTYLSPFDINDKGVNKKKNLSKI